MHVCQVFRFWYYIGSREEISAVFANKDKLIKKSWKLLFLHCSKSSYNVKNDVLTIFRGFFFSIPNIGFHFSCYMNCWNLRLIEKHMNLEVYSTVNHCVPVSSKLLFILEIINFNSIHIVYFEFANFSVKKNLCGDGFPNYYTFWFGLLCPMCLRVDAAKRCKNLRGPRCKY